MNRNSQRLIARMSGLLLLSAVLMPSLVGSVQATEKKIALESNDQSDVSQSSKQDLRIGNPEDPNTNSPDSNVVPNEPQKVSPSSSGVSDSEITEQANTILRQVGLPSLDQLGQEREKKCEAEQFQGWSIGSPNQSSCFVQVEPGWIITDYTVDRQEKYRGGQVSVSNLVKDGVTVVSEKEVGDKFNLALEMSAKLKVVEVKQRIEAAYQKNREYFASVSSSVPALNMKVTANGGAFRRAYIKGILRAKLRRVG